MECPAHLRIFYPKRVNIGQIRYYFKQRTYINPSRIFFSWFLNYICIYTSPPHTRNTFFFNLAYSPMRVPIKETIQLERMFIFILFVLRSTLISNW